VSRFAGGRNGEEFPLPLPCLGLEVGENCVVWWAPKGERKEKEKEICKCVVICI
jgi:hypothetical protein